MALPTERGEQPIRPLVFISCGQYTDQEKRLGERVKQVVERLTGCDGYFAESQNSLDGLSQNIFGALNLAAGFIAIMHHRGHVGTPSGPLIRGSVWVEQEIAIAAFVQSTRSSALPVLLYLQKGVAREGVRQQLILRPFEFEKDDEVLADVEAQIKSRGFAPRAVRTQGTRSAADGFVSELTGTHSGFYIGEPRIAPRSEHFYRFACAPHDDSVTQPLTQAVEERVGQCIAQAFGSPPPQEPPQRTNKMTTFIREGIFNIEQRFAVTAAGALGFVTLACKRDAMTGSLTFIPTEFLYNLGAFLRCASLFYRGAGYRGGVVVKTELKTPQALVMENTTRSVQTRGPHLFTGLMPTIKGDDLRLSDDVDNIQSLTPGQLSDVFESVMLEVARHNGKALGPSFRTDVNPVIETIMAQIA